MSASKSTIGVTTLLSPRLIWLAYALALLVFISPPSGFLWGVQYRQDVSILAIVFCIAAIGIGSFAIRKNRETPRLKTEYILDETKFYGLVLLLMVTAFAMKFVSLGGIPLIQRVSRYVESSGYFDFFLSGSVVLGLVAFQKFRHTRNSSYLVHLTLMLAGNSLLDIRQYVVYLLLGVGILWSLSLSPGKGLLLISIATFLSLASITIFAFLRFGASLARNFDGLSTVLDVIRGELQHAFFLGTSAIYSFPDRLNGTYSLTDLYWLLLPNEDRGAALINSRIVGSFSAQSISFPFGYVVDFGWSGAILFCFFLGIAGTFIYSKTDSLDFNRTYTLIYILFVLSSLWSLRSGMSPLSIQLLFWWIFIRALDIKDIRVINLYSAGIIALFLFGIAHEFFIN